MSIFSVGISLRSESVTVQELTALAGAEPTRSHSRGDRISPRLVSSATRPNNFWSKRSDIAHDTWTLEPHWPSIAPILEALAASPDHGVTAKLSIGTNAQGSGFSFDIDPDKLGLLTRAGCGIWIDTYQGDRTRSDRPDDYPFPEGGTLSAPRGFARARRSVYQTLRKINPFGEMRRHRTKSLQKSNDPQPRVDKGKSDKWNNWGTNVALDHSLFSIGACEWASHSHSVSPSR